MRLIELAKRFLSSERGNVGLILGISALPMMLIAGGAIDYLRAYKAQSTLQAAVDAAALAGGASSNPKDAIVKQTIRDYLRENDADNISGGLRAVKISKPDKDSFKVMASVAVKTTLLKIAGLTEIEINANAEVKRSYGWLEVAMVLDNTASMGGSKLTALKDSAHLLVNELFADPNNSEVRVALVPFSQYVNIGMGNRNAAWMAVPGDYSAKENICEWKQPKPTNCRKDTCTYNDDGVPVSYQCTTCDGDWEEVCKTKKVKHEWHGCVGSRNAPLDAEDSHPETAYPGVLDAWCPSPLTPLTRDRGLIGSEIDAMTATGETYIPAGLMWGWNAVSSAAPLSQGTSEAQAGVNKAVVLMTDGANHMSASYPAHDVGDNGANANVKTAELCANIKAAGIKVFTVSFEVADAATESMLKACASNADAYFDADNPAQLKSAFKAIGGALSMLRISQ